MLICGGSSRRISRGSVSAILRARSTFFWQLGLCLRLRVRGLRTWGRGLPGRECGSVALDAYCPGCIGDGSGMLQDGPFRYVRNPLYLGTFLHTLALALLMPLSGAIFCIVAIGVLQLRLIFAEEPFSQRKAGSSLRGLLLARPPYRACAARAGCGGGPGTALGAGVSRRDLYVGRGWFVCCCGLAL